MIELAKLYKSVILDKIEKVAKSQDEVDLQVFLDHLPAVIDAEVPDESRDFLYEFINTQMFAYYIECLY